jgi:hypothetical protein
MLVWSRWGFLVPAIGFGCLLAAEFGVEAATADDQFYQTHAWPMAAAFGVAGVVVALLGRYVNRREGRRLIDPETGREVIMGGKSTFFFIPMEYWGPLLLIVGLVAAFAGPQ